MGTVPSTPSRFATIRFLLGALSARLGKEMSTQAILLLGFALTQTAVLGSRLLAGLTIAAAIGGPLFGAILDRSHRPGRIMGGAIGLFALGIAMISFSLDRIPESGSIALAVLFGLVMPAVSACWSSQIRLFMPPDRMTQGSTIDAASINITGLAGPALAGVIAAIAGAHWAVGLLVAFLVAAIPAALALPNPDRPPNGQTTSFKEDITAGFSAIGASRALLSNAALSSLSYCGIGMLWVMAPVLGRDVFDDPNYGGILMSMLSVGATAMTLAGRKRLTEHNADAVVFITTVVLLLGLGLLILPASPWLVITAMLVVGLAAGPQLAATFAVRQREAPARYHSQILTTGGSLKITAAAGGTALAGLLVERSVSLTAGVAAAMQLVALVAFLVIEGREGWLRLLGLKGQRRAFDASG